MQFSFDLGRDPAYGDRDFLPAPCNAQALGWLRRWPDWPGPLVLLHGPPGCGKTHLARLFAERADAGFLDPDRLTEALDPPVWRTRRAHVVEHADRLSDEAALFHLFNGARSSDGHLLLTSRWPLPAWPLRLPDLRSRLRASPSVAIGPPDDALLGALLIKLFADRQLWVDDAVIGYLVGRMERSFAAARRTVAALDAAALRTRKRITLASAREALDGREASGGRDRTDGRRAPE